MHAADVVESLPTVLPDDDVLAAVRTLSQRGLPGLVVADDRGEVVGCISWVDLLRAVFPQYLMDDPALARVIDEGRADRMAAALAGISVREVLTRGPDRIPRVGPQATLVELAESMVRRKCPFALVERHEGGVLGVVTANRLLDVLATAEEAS